MQAALIIVLLLLLIMWCFHYHENAISDDLNQEQLENCEIISVAKKIISSIYKCDQSLQTGKLEFSSVGEWSGTTQSMHDNKHNDNDNAH